MEQRRPPRSPGRGGTGTRRRRCRCSPAPGDDLYTVVHPLDAVLHHGDVLPDGHGGRLAGGAAHADGVHTALDLIVDEAAEGVVVDIPRWRQRGVAMATQLPVKTGVRIKNILSNQSIRSVLLMVRNQNRPLNIHIQVQSFRCIRRRQGYRPPPGRAHGRPDRGPGAV